MNRMFTAELAHILVHHLRDSLDFARSDLEEVRERFSDLAREFLEGDDPGLIFRYLVYSAMEYVAAVSIISAIEDVLDKSGVALGKRNRRTGRKSAKEERID